MEFSRRHLLGRAVATAALTPFSSIASGCGGGNRLPLIDDRGEEQRYEATALPPEHEPGEERWLEAQDVLENLAVFPLGIASGDPGPNAIVLWTRFFPGEKQDAEVCLVVVDDDDRVVFDSDLEMASDGFLFVDLEGLQAHKDHRFLFIVQTTEFLRRSPIGYFKTSPLEGELVDVTLTASCCTKYNYPLKTLSTAANEEDVSAHLLLGDTVYADGAYDLATYRSHWHRTLASSGYRALRASTSLLCTWDDHEVRNNFDPETVDAKQLAAAQKAFFENSPIRRLAEAPNQIWRKTSFGKTVDVFVLDARSERRPSSKETADESFLSAEQMLFLKDGLKASTARFKCIITTVPVSNLPFLIEGADRWEGYPKTRKDLLSFIDDEIEGAFFLTGDIHLAFGGRTSPEGVGSAIVEIAIGPSGQFQNPTQGLFVLPQFDAAFSENNYGRLEFRPEAGEVVVTWVRADGSPIYKKHYAL